MGRFDPAHAPLGIHALVFTVAAALTWLVGGRRALYANELSERTRFGQALVGALLLGGVASLPELAMSVTASAAGDAALSITTLLGGIPVTVAFPEPTTIYASVRIGRYELAFADAFGSNLMSIGLVYAADLAYPGGPILNHADRAALIATLLGISSTAIYLTGLIQRARVGLWKLGLDSLLALCAYAVGLVLMYSVGS